MKRRDVLAGAATLLAAPHIARGAGAPIVLKFPHDVPTTQIKGMAAERLRKLVVERLKGRVVIEVFPNGQLYSNEGDALEALQQNAVQLVMPTFAKWTPLVPAFAVFELPFVVTSSAVMKKAVQSPEVGGRLFGQKLRAKGLTMLEVAPDGLRDMDTRRRPVLKVEDFVGLKIRIQNSTTFTAFMKYAKAIPVPISSSETYSAISAGIVDGWEAPFDAIYSTKTYEVAPIISVTNHVYNAYLLATNANFWDGLPPDIRTDLKQVLDEVAAWQWSYADQLQRESRKKLAAARHVKIYDLDPVEKARMVKYFRGMHAQFRDVVGADVLEAMYKIADADAATHA